METINLISKPRYKQMEITLQIDSLIVCGRPQTINSPFLQIIKVPAHIAIRWQNETNAFYKLQEEMLSYIGEGEKEVEV